MSEQDDTDEGSDWYKQLCDPPPWTEEEKLAARRDFAEQIRTRDRGPWTDLPDEKTMNRMIEEGARRGVLPHWTHGTPAVLYHPYKGGLPLPKPVIFEGLFLYYEHPANGTTGY
jgi:hypothetical protein